MRPLIIIGIGGNAHDVMDVVDALNGRMPDWRVAGFLDDGRQQGSIHMGVGILGAVHDARRIADSPELHDAQFLNTIGSEKTYAARGTIIERTGLPPERFATLVHPLASVSPRARLGRGVCVNACASIGGEVTIGDYVWLGPGSIIGHDSVLEAHTSVAPGAVVSGCVRVGEGCYIGAGAHVRQRIVIGARALIGMSAVVVKDVPSETVVIGNPARELSHARRRV